MGMGRGDGNGGGIRREREDAVHRLHKHSNPTGASCARALNGSSEQGSGILITARLSVLARNFSN